jgi:hypothetical protein
MDPADENGIEATRPEAPALGLAATKSARRRTVGISRDEGGAGWRKASRSGRR